MKSFEWNNILVAILGFPPFGCTIARQLLSPRLSAKQSHSFLRPQAQSSARSSVRCWLQHFKTRPIACPAFIHGSPSWPPYPWSCVSARVSPLLTPHPSLCVVSTFNPSSTTWITFTNCHLANVRLLYGGHYHHPVLVCPNYPSRIGSSPSLPWNYV